MNLLRRKVDVEEKMDYKKKESIYKSRFIKFVKCN